MNAKIIAHGLAKVVTSKKFLFGLGIVGVGLVGGTAITGTISAKKHVDEAKEKKLADLEAQQDVFPDDIEDLENQPLTKSEVAKAVWKDYIPLALSTATTIYIFYRLVLKLNDENLALRGLLSMSEATVHRMETRMVDKLGADKALPIVSDARADALRDTEEPVPVSYARSELPIDASPDDIIGFCDIWSKRTFKSTKVQILKALEIVNLAIHDYGEASLSDFYEALGIEGSDAGDLVGWQSSSINEYKLDIYFDGKMCGAYVDSDGRPWTYLRFNKDPDLLPQSECH